MSARIEMILFFHCFKLQQNLAFIIEDISSRMDIGIFGDESNIDAVYAPFIFQSFRQVIPPLLNEIIIA
jgi:hypothetical protein